MLGGRGFREARVRIKQQSYWLRESGNTVVLMAHALLLPDTIVNTAVEDNMALKLSNVAWMLCLFLLSLISPAEAWDGGDALALLLGTVISVVGVCACLGWYARRRNGQF